MVWSVYDSRWMVRNLSVLALSSRFDGPWTAISTTATTISFSTRSVESF